MSDNIYCVNPTYRFSIDTLYIGFRCEPIVGEHILEEINNYLSSNLLFSLNRENYGNVYYYDTYKNEDNGIVLFARPRKGLKNDYLTLQIGGIFFHDILDSEKFLDWLFSSWFAVEIVLQRVDVALDVLYENYPNGEISDKGFMPRFPLPSYSPEYHYTKVDFKIDGRLYNDLFVVNMVSQGKSDKRLRVYDKSLDCYEKWGDGYGEVYMLDKTYSQVYRIEFQVRGKTLKGWFSDYKEHYKVINRQTLIEALFQYVFAKYQFTNIDMGLVDKALHKSFTFHKLKRKYNLESKLLYHKQRQNAEYKEVCRLYDKIQAMRYILISQNFVKEKCLTDDKDVKKALESFFVDFYNLQKTNASQIEFDFERGKKNE